MQHLRELSWAIGVMSSVIALHASAWQAQKPPVYEVIDILRRSPSVANAISEGQDGICVVGSYTDSRTESGFLWRESDNSVQRLPSSFFFGDAAALSISKDLCGSGYAEAVGWSKRLYPTRATLWADGTPYEMRPFEGHDTTIAYAISRDFIVGVSKKPSSATSTPRSFITRVEDAFFGRPIRPLIPNDPGSVADGVEAFPVPGGFTYKAAGTTTSDKCFAIREGDQIPTIFFNTMRTCTVYGTSIHRDINGSDLVVVGGVWDGVVGNHMKPFFAIPFKNDSRILPSPCNGDAVARASNEAISFGGEFGANVVGDCLGYDAFQIAMLGDRQIPFKLNNLISARQRRQWDLREARGINIGEVENIVGRALYEGAWRAYLAKSNVRAPAILKPQGTGRNGARLRFDLHNLEKGYVANNLASLHVDAELSPNMNSRQTAEQIADWVSKTSAGLWQAEVFCDAKDQKDCERGRDHALRFEHRYDHQAPWRMVAEIENLNSEANSVELAFDDPLSRPNKIFYAVYTVGITGGTVEEETGEPLLIDIGDGSYEIPLSKGMTANDIMKMLCEWQGEGIFCLGDKIEVWVTGYHAVRGKLVIGAPSGIFSVQMGINAYGWISPHDQL